MNPVKSVRTAAVVSLALFGLWTFLTSVCYIFQPALLRFFMNGYSDNTGRIFLLTTSSSFLEIFLYVSAAVMLYRGKERYTPLVISAVTWGAFAAVNSILSLIEIRLTVPFGGVEKIAALSAFSTVTAHLNFLIAAGGTIVIAAGAVNAYAKNRETENGFPYEKAVK